LIASTIGLAEGKVDLDGLGEDLREAGASAGVARAVGSSPGVRRRTTATDGDAGTRPDPAGFGVTRLSVPVVEKPLAP